MKITYILTVVLIGVFVFSCAKKQEEKELKNMPVKEELIMHVPSEMTNLMLRMFEFQENSKKQIEKGNVPLDFPEKFKKIHTTELSDQFEHDTSFKAFTDIYYTNIKILGESTKENAKKNFNTTIQSCIACHETTCHGPITRIKKLFIK